jgi:hypothetical protein
LPFQIPGLMRIGQRQPGELINPQGVLTKGIPQSNTIHKQAPPSRRRAPPYLAVRDGPFRPTEGDERAGQAVRLSTVPAGRGRNRGPRHARRWRDGVGRRRSDRSPLALLSLSQPTSPATHPAQTQTNQLSLPLPASASSFRLPPSGFHLPARKIVKLFDPLPKCMSLNPRHFQTIIFGRLSLSAWYSNNRG